MTHTVNPGAPGIILPRCNPFGHSTGRGGDRGPRHLMGGLYGPEFEGPVKWECTNTADGIYVMTCGCGHRGQRMPLCYPHVRMIGKRQSDTCPRCVMPAPALELHEAIQRARGTVVLLNSTGAPRDRVLAAIGREEDLSAAMTDLYMRGIIHRCPLILTEVS